MAKVRLARCRLDRRAGLVERVVRAVHAALRRRLLVLLDGHEILLKPALRAARRAAAVGRRGRGQPGIVAAAAPPTPGVSWVGSPASGPPARRTGCPPGRSPTRPPRTGAAAAPGRPRGAARWATPGAARPRSAPARRAPA